MLMPQTELLLAPELLTPWCKPDGVMRLSNSQLCDGLKQFFICNEVSGPIHDAVGGSSAVETRGYDAYSDPVMYATDPVEGKVMRTTYTSNFMRFAPTDDLVWYGSTYTLIGRVKFDSVVDDPQVFAGPEWSNGGQFIRARSSLIYHSANGNAISLQSPDHTDGIFQTHMIRRDKNYCEYWIDGVLQDTVTSYSTTSELGLCYLTGDTNDRFSGDISWLAGWAGRYLSDPDVHDFIGDPYQVVAPALSEGVFLSDAQATLSVVSLDAVLQKHISLTAQNDAALQQQLSETIGADAPIEASVSISSSSEAAIKALSEIQVSAQAAVEKLMAVGANIDTAIESTIESQAQSDSVIEKPIDVTTGVDVAVLDSLSVQLGVDSQIKAAISSSADIAAIVEAMRAATISTNAIISAPGTYDQSQVDAALLDVMALSSTVDSAVLSSLSALATASAVVAISPLTQTSVDSAVELPRYEFMGAGAVLASDGTVSQAISDSLIEMVVTIECFIDTALASAGELGVLSDARLVVSDVITSISNAILTRGIDSSSTTDAVIVTESEVDNISGFLRAYSPISGFLKRI